MRTRSVAALSPDVLPVLAVSVALALLGMLAPVGGPLAAQTGPEAVPVDVEAIPVDPVEVPVDVEAVPVDPVEVPVDVEAVPVDPVAVQVGSEAASGWDVNDPPFPMEEVEIDVDEGTWMSLDVSPDGREIVFDFLGDLYVIPMEGGEARALTDEVAWNMQPRYSPDGEWIAFTSDRGGGDNLWVMRPDGTDPRPVTTEEFRLVNGPVWTPDSEYLAGRKHYTSARSLGAGEVWLYHRSGGSGLRLVERPNDQQDLNEPAFSPDGRHLYFSQDVTPGETFEYNKDSSEGIYAIRRLDRETGRLETLIEGPGGAVRPTPSPDGRYLAFVRRVHFQSTLFLKDLRSGREWPVHDGLERDMQEIWAIHGVYPTMAWTPDSKSLVFWAGGEIRRLEVESGEVEPIPFRVRTTRRVAPALRSTVEVHPDTFDVRMLRWTEVSPDGDRVLFQALGRIWVRDLPDGPPRRLTRQEDHFELYPSWSRDGERVTYVSWSDDELGAVRIAPARGAREGRILTPEPGHYVEPAFTPDGDEVVYRKTAGGHVTSPLWSADAGIHRVPAEGGEPRRITRSGQGPSFGADPDRVFLRDREEGRRVLRSVRLDGSDERTHVRSEWATGFAVSPDQRWVAWTERYQAYLAPLVPAGGPVELSPDTRAVPVRRVSRDAGEGIHWSGDGRTLHWTVGPELFSLDVARAFEWLEGEDGDGSGRPEDGGGARDAADRTPALPVATSWSIGFQAASDRPSGSVALVGARLVTMRGDEVIEDGTVVVRQNRITAVGPRDRVEVPADAHRIDASGHTILPGLIDVHWHGSQGREGIIPERNRLNHASLAFGVTTIHDPSNVTSEIFAASELARAGEVVAPRIFSTGRILYGATTDFTAEVDSLEDARQHLRRLKAAGAFSVKSYNQPRRDQRQQILAAARELDMMVVPEGGALFHQNMSQVVDGHTGVEHSLPVARVYDDVVQLWSATEVGYTPTLVVAFGGLSGEFWWYERTNVWENERLMRFNPPGVVEARARRRQMAPEEEYNHLRTAAHTRKLHDAGVGVQLGAHGQRNGLDAHWELWMMEKGGMTPHQALRVATLNGARYLGLDGDIGSLEEGKLADLVVLEENPLDDLRASQEIRWTMVNGRLFDARTLDEVGNHPRERAPFFWEQPPEVPAGGGTR